MNDSKKPKKHRCEIGDGRIFCSSMIDSKRHFWLGWIDGSSLLVEYCPFCGVNCAELNSKGNDES